MMMVSQALIRNNLPISWLSDQKLDLANKSACDCVGSHFERKPSDSWLCKLSVVVNELKRHQFEMGRKPSTGAVAEKSIVRGWWVIAQVEARLKSRAEAVRILLHAYKLQLR